MKETRMICPVLIVEDDSDLCKILMTVLTRICPVHVENNLENARLYLAGLHGKRFLPAVILMDNNLPDGNGLDYIGKIHSLYPAIKMVLMTADIAEGLKEKAILEGASYFVAKPFRLSAISNIILTLCPDLRAA